MCLCTFRDLESGLSETCVNTRKEGELCLSRTNSGKTLVEARSDTDGQIVLFSGVWKRKTNRTISQLIPSAVSFKISGA